MLKDNLYAELMEDLHSILRVKCRGCEVRILGADLELTALSMDELAVMGVISSVEYITTE